MAPPPPAPYPADKPRSLEQYNLEAAYVDYVTWVERQKVVAISHALDREDPPVGEKWVRDPPVHWERSSGDGDGIVLIGEIRRSCEAGQPISASNCQLVLLRAFVSLSARGPASSPVAAWTQRTFDPDALIASWKRKGIQPTTSPYDRLREDQFSEQPSPVSMLEENVTVVRVTSRECPGMSDAMGALENQSVRVPIDWQAVGLHDTRGRLPQPHATSDTVTFNLWTDWGPTKLVASYNGLNELTSPIFDAVDRCEGRLS